MSEKENALVQMFTEKLPKHIPQKAVPTIAHWLVKHEVALTIAAERSTKLGDYRSPRKGHGHRISVNHNLNSYAFLNTLVHEMAHLVTWEQHKHRVKSHGIEWKLNYKALMNDYLGKAIFPDDLEKAINQYMRNPAASSCSDPNLVRAFRKYDAPSGNEMSEKKLLEDIPFNTKFVYEGRLFAKIDQAQKRIICRELHTAASYRFNPVTEVWVFNIPFLEQVAKENEQKGLSTILGMPVWGVPNGLHFRLEDGRTFKKIKKLRKKYECVEFSTNKVYTISANTLTKISLSELLALLQAPVTIHSSLPQGMAYLADLPNAAQFIIKEHPFKKGRKRRTRYECISLLDGKVYTVSGKAVVRVLV